MKMAETPEKHKELRTPIDTRVILLILCFVIGFQSYLYLVGEEFGDFNIADGIALAAPLAVGIAGIYVGKRYGGSQIFGRAYTALGIGFIFYFMGEITWYYYETVLEIYPYPSLADVFYLAFYPFLIFHLIVHIRYFKRKTDDSTKILFIVLAASFVMFYAHTTIQDYQEINAEFLLGLAYVILAASLLSLAIHGAIVFNQSVLSGVWVLLMIGILMYSLADLWYYYLEWFEMYTGVHAVNSLWIFGFLIILYALIKHEKTI